MGISEDAKLQALTDHYKDTFRIVGDHLKLRERLFLYALILIGLQFLKESSKAIADFLKTHIGFQVLADKESLNAILWFALLAVVIRYFQTNIHINRQYKYIHSLEDKFDSMFGESIIEREGKHYLADYPWFSEWADILYTWVFPGLLVFTGGFKIIKDWPGWENIGVPYFLSGIFFLMIFCSVILYVGSLKFELKKKKSG